SAGGIAVAFAADLDDIVRLHLRRAAADPPFRGRRGDAPGPGRGGVQRHARRDLLRDFPHSGVLLHPPAVWGAAEAKCSYGCSGREAARGGGACGGLDGTAFGTIRRASWVRRFEGPPIGGAEGPPHRWRRFHLGETFRRTVSDPRKCFTQANE